MLNRIHTYTHAGVLDFSRTHTRTHTHAHAHTHTYTHIHTYTHVQVLAEMNQHFEVVVNYAPEHASTVSTVLQSAEALVADIRTHHAQARACESVCVCVSNHHW